MTENQQQSVDVSKLWDEFQENVSKRKGDIEKVLNEDAEQVQKLCDELEELRTTTEENHLKHIRNDLERRNVLNERLEEEANLCERFRKIDVKSKANKGYIKLL